MSIYDPYFLKQLDQMRQKTVYARITALDYDDLPKEDFEGRIIDGSITVDGKSSLRRVCSMSLVATKEDQVITDIYWAYDTKFKVEIGLQNLIDSSQPDIVWFPQGVFIITSFSKNQDTTSSLKISISGQDKMCRLNGTINGALPHEVNFGEIDEEQQDKSIITYKVPIREIIFNAVREYGRERPENVIINDLEDHGYELWEYKGEEPMYFVALYDESTQQLGRIVNFSFDAAPGGVTKFYPLNSLTSKKVPHQDFDIINYGGKQAVVIKVNYGETAGYRRTELIYPKDLICGAGEPLTAMLDKLVDMLGEYEYFYNIYGQFVFQKKKNYVQQLFSPTTGALMNDMVYLPSPYAYEFEDNNLIINKSFSPQIDSVRNDFVVWGTKKTNKVERPIHARYAIDVKPTYYKALTDVITADGTVIHFAGQEFTVPEYDWRELIYQMAKDFYKLNMPTGISDIYKITGYEQYYSDLEGFWRQLYDPNGSPDEYDATTHWTVKMDDPASLFFWFDFLEPNAEYAKFSVGEIGQRTKVENNQKGGITSIYYKETPEVEFFLPGETLTDEFAPCLVITEDMREFFNISGQGNTVISAINSLIQQHSFVTQTTNLSVVPIYYLDVNTRIKLNNEDYEVTSITYQLGYSGNMSLSAHKLNPTIQ